MRKFKTVSGYQEVSKVDTAESIALVRVSGNGIKVSNAYNIYSILLLYILLYYTLLYRKSDTLILSQFFRCKEMTVNHLKWYHHFGAKLKPKIRLIPYPLIWNIKKELNIVTV